MQNLPVDWISLNGPGKNLEREDWQEVGKIQGMHMALEEDKAELRGKV